MQNAKSLEKPTLYYDERVNIEHAAPRDIAFLPWVL